MQDVQTGFTPHIAECVSWRQWIKEELKLIEDTLDETVRKIDREENREERLL